MNQIAYVKINSEFEPRKQFRVHKYAGVIHLSIVGDKGLSTLSTTKVGELQALVDGLQDLINEMKKS
jgi:hypothetical protein